MYRVLIRWIIHFSTLFARGRFHQDAWRFSVQSIREVVLIYQSHYLLLYELLFVRQCITFNMQLLGMQLTLFICVFATRYLFHWYSLKVSLFFRSTFSRFYPSFWTVLEQVFDTWLLFLENIPFLNFVFSLSNFFLNVLLKACFFLIKSQGFVSFARAMASPHLQKNVWFYSFHNRFFLCFSHWTSVFKFCVVDNFFPRFFLRFLFLLNVFLSRVWLSFDNAFADLADR